MPAPLNPFDLRIMNALNAYATRWTRVDHLIAFIGRNDFMAGVVPITAYWWAWFRRKRECLPDRKVVIAAILGGVVALLVGRALGIMLVFRPRPIHDPALAFVHPLGVGPTELSGWSSFPSDHAVMDYALATGLWFVSRRMGLLVMIYMLVAPLFARVYLGLHYPTDILGGCLIGVLIGWLAQWPKFREWVSKPFLWAFEKNPGLAYAASFVLSHQLATMFDDSRKLMKILFHVSMS